MTSANGPICSSNSPFGMPVSSSSNYYFQCDGDTIELSTQRKPASSSDTGYPGEFCFGEDSGTYYLYYCVSSDSWVRVAFSTF
jgi:hypothetical protein